MSNELESDRAMVMNLESFGVDGVQRLQCDRDRAAKFDKPAVKIMFQVTDSEIVRFLLERGLRFRNLGFCGHDLMWTATFNAPQCTTVPIYPEGLAFFSPFLEGHGAFVCDQDLALTVRIRDFNRRFGGLQVSPRLRFACCRRRYRGATGSCS